MAKIIKRREVKYVPHYEHTFVDKNGELRAGYECDPQGNRLEPETEFTKWVRLEVENGTLYDMGVHTWEKKEVVPGELLCHCGRLNPIWGGGDFTCECGQWYNTFGQELRHPRHWGEETGERFDDNGNYIGGGPDPFF